MARWAYVDSAGITTIRMSLEGELPNGFTVMVEAELVRRSSWRDSDVLLRSVLMYSPLGEFEIEPDEEMQSTILSKVESWRWGAGYDDICEAYHLEDYSVVGTLDLSDVEV